MKPAVAFLLLLLGPCVEDAPGQLPIQTWLGSRWLNPVVHLTLPSVKIWSPVIYPPDTTRWCSWRQPLHQSRFCLEDAHSSVQLESMMLIKKNRLECNWFQAWCWKHMLVHTKLGLLQHSLVGLLQYTFVGLLQHFLLLQRWNLWLPERRRLARMKSNRYMCWLLAEAPVSTHLGALQQTFAAPLMPTLAYRREHHL